MALKKPSSIPFVFFYCVIILFVAKLVTFLLERGGGL